MTKEGGRIQEEGKERKEEGYMMREKRGGRIQDKRKVGGRIQNEGKERRKDTG